ncbi:zinc-binding metallopeptidase family protein [Methylomagnum sp.]
MKIFHCNHCRQLVFFESIQCVKCGHALAYLPDQADMASLEALGNGLWQPPAAGGRTYRLCENYSRENVCNWAVPAADSHPLCQSCRLTRTIPDLEQPGHKVDWYKLEVAKRRLIYTLVNLGLPLANKADDPERGLAFEFLADPDDPDAPPVLTGHDNGLITINLVEADDAEREKRRQQMGEPYRTLLGHFRHEIGHYYWNRLIDGSRRIDGFRQLFGDEREDYGQALQEHYEAGAPSDWQAHYVSQYASSHPWEDWAETFAHYLHMVDTLETAAACGLSLKPPRPDEPSLELERAEDIPDQSFEALMENWFPLTYVLNNLNRGMGLADAYPFILRDSVIDKLRFVHESIGAQGFSMLPRQGS